MTLHVGDPAPWFTARAASNPHYQFDTVAGRYVVLAFLDSASSESGARFLARLMTQRALFDDERACFFGVTTDPADEQRLAESLPGIRWFFDNDLAVSRLYSAIEGAENHPHALVLDPLLRISPEPRCRCSSRPGCACAHCDPSGCTASQPSRAAGTGFDTAARL